MGNYYETFYPPFFMETRHPFNYDMLSVNAKAYDRDDSLIEEDFARRLEAIEPIDTSDIRFESENQVLKLNGEVTSLAVLRFIENMADRILGTRSVKSELVVRRAGATAAQPGIVISEINGQDHRLPQDPLPPVMRSTPEKPKNTSS